jgi:hypothetical protein
VKAPSVGKVGDHKRPRPAATPAGMAANDAQRLASVLVFIVAYLPLEDV